MSKNLHLAGHEGEWHEVILRHTATVAIGRCAVRQISGDAATFYDTDRADTREGPVPGRYFVHGCFAVLKGRGEAVFEFAAIEP